ncbi:MAG: DNA-directed RNA polymerase subunit beta [Candidatus Promineifilaceae bacterium]
MANSPVKTYAQTTDPLELPTLIDVQLTSFATFIKEGLAELFAEISPIESFSRDMKLYFPSDQPEAQGFGLKYWFEEPKYSVEECVERDMSYAASLYVKVMLYSQNQDQPIIQDIFMGDFPLMTPAGTFIINGTERVVVSQLIRSPGVYFEAEEELATGRPLAMAKLIPDRGAWMEFETRKTDYLTVKFNRKRTVPVTLFLRALAAVDDGLDQQLIEKGSDEELLALFEDLDTNAEHRYIQGSIEQEPQWDEDKPLAEQSLIEFYKRMRPGDPPTLDNAQQYMVEQLFDNRRYDLARVGRYKLNKRLNLQEIVPESHRTLTQYDVVRLIRHMILINNGQEGADDIDHLGNRRVKTVGELLQAKLRVGLRRMERVVRERMSIRETDTLTAVQLINIRPVVAAIREFFGSSQLSQFMEQANPLAELTHKRTLSALGPGGLRRERAGFEVRDVHHSHYGRICPIETPEGPNIGLIGRLATYGRVNSYGFIETPYRRVLNTIELDSPDLEGHDALVDILHPKSGKVLVKAGETITAKDAKAIKAAKFETPISVVPFLTDEIVYMSADEEDRYTIAQANAALDDRRQFVGKRVSARRNQQFRFASVQRVDFMDVAPRQIVGISAALIPFLEHDDANRALMGSNMQRQAVPLLRPDVAVVSTGMEWQAAYNSGQVIIADEEGEVLSVTGDRIILMGENGPRTYKLRKYNRSNQSTCIDQRPIVVKGQRVHPGMILADSSSTQSGQLALGQDVVVAFLSWEGGNFEDAILVSERLVREDRFTSVHIEKHEVEARDTKLGPEEITFDIPNVSDDALKDLNEEGIIRIGANVNENDILVGKITPKGEKELSPEEKLLRAIFGDKAREVKDSSLRLPNGARGKVVDVQVFTRQQDRDLPAGVETMVRVSVAQRRKISEGDKMAGRHGNKGVISKVVPIEDMPFLADGTPVDIILNPIGVPGRMNLGQILETHLGWAANRLGFRAVTPVFDGASEQEIAAELARAWLVDHAWRQVTDWALSWLEEIEYDLDTLENDAEARQLFISAWLEGKPYDADRLATDRAYARYSVAREWLRERGWEPDETLPPTDDWAAMRKADWEPYNAAAIEVGMREWHAFVVERYSDDLPEEMRKAVVRELSLEQLIANAEQITLRTGQPAPILGKERLIDGKSGEPYAQPVTVGVIHMLKLAHLVEDKVHARSTGPYSLVTQQPLGGKAQFGGQRFGEMEVWALEAYGAAHTLQEMLTVKSDDVQGRVKTYEAIVKNEPLEEPGIPASFRVLVKELQSLGLAVEAVTEGGEVIRFGKEDDKRQRHHYVGTGLMDLARNRR